MERISLETDRKSIIAEHMHRYQISSNICFGHVLDISCGIGYGSKIITSNSNVNKYTGIDISENEIKYANKNFSEINTKFLQGDICDIKFEDETFDSIVCLETLEHIDNPDLALKELSRVIKKNGTLIASVPQKAYEEKCENAYGPNPHHKHKFSKNDFEDIISSHFQNYRIISTGVIFGTITEGRRIFSELDESFVPEGSFLCIASKNNSVSDQVKKIEGTFIPSISMLEYDEEASIPLRATVNELEKMIKEKDKIISQNDIIIKDKAQTIKAMEELVKQKDEVIKKSESMIKEKDKIINQNDIIIKDKAQTIKAIEELVKQKDEVIKKSESMIEERDQAIRSIEEVVQKRWEIIQEYEKKLQEITK